MGRERDDKREPTAEEGLALMEAFRGVHDPKLRHSLIVMAKALALAEAGPEMLRKLRRDGPH